MRKPLVTRPAGLAAASGLASLAIATGGLAIATVPAQAGTPQLPAQSRGYRHGAVPMVGSTHANVHTSAGAAASTNLQYWGGTNGVGVTTGAPKVYLVFWGSQWGKAATDAKNDTTLAGDGSGIAPVLQEFFKGLGTGGETWSGVMTQYCEGIAKGTADCPADSAHVGYPAGGALAGVWVDSAAAAPDQASGNAIGQEAVTAATHFGNTTAASNRNAQYVVVSPSGTHPDGFGNPGTTFCAWHDFTGDNGLNGGPVNSPNGPVTFTNLPYIPDQGAGCGANKVNAGAAGNLDGLTIVEGHEYAETITDQHPYADSPSATAISSGGWSDAAGAQENGDKCAWVTAGPGAMTNLALTTGSFAVQGTWSNDANGGAGGCAVSHPIVGGGAQGNTVTVTNPGNQSGTVGTAAGLQIQASDSAVGQALSYSAAGLPAGLSINSSTGLISGTPSTAGTTNVTVTVNDSTGASGSTTFSWTENTTGGGSVTVASPGDQTNYLWDWVDFYVTATDSDSSQTLTYSATGLPSGLSIDSSSGEISGYTDTSGTTSVTITATDGTGASGSTTFTWNVAGF